MYVPTSLLRRHVLESNLIEGYRIKSGLPLYTSHLSAAIYVARSPLFRLPPHPREIHAILARDTEMHCFGGYYRSCRVWVGDELCPLPLDVSRLMRDWWRIVEDSFRVIGRSKYRSRAERARMALFLHSWLLAIHPFRDGNGRTARLFLNALRLRYGLSWLIIPASNRPAYYRQIRHIESVFRGEYPDVYD